MKVLNVDMETAESNDYRKMSKKSRDTNGVLAVT